MGKTQQAMMAARGFVTAVEAANKIGRDTASIYALVKSGHIEGVQIGKSWYVSWASMLKYLGPQAAQLLGLK